MKTGRAVKQHLPRKKRKIRNLRGFYTNNLFHFTRGRYRVKRSQKE